VTTTVRTYRAQVLEVKDGDTVKLAVALRKSRMPDQDLGFHLYVRDRNLVLHDAFRLFGINCPEKRTIEGIAAADYLRGRIPVGSWLSVDTRQVKGRDEQEKYGRWLGTLRVRHDDAMSLNDELVLLGLALPWDGTGPRPT
jgi:endonuclease YncB( thermonuclease family)